MVHVRLIKLPYLATLSDQVTTKTVDESDCHQACIYLCFRSFIPRFYKTVKYNLAKKSTCLF